MIIMRTTLRHRAPNTYYGQWPAKNSAIPGLKTPVHCP
jgi:hypothetical protein